MHFKTTHRASRPAAEIETALKSAAESNRRAASRQTFYAQLSAYAVLATIVSFLLAAVLAPILSPLAKLLCALGLGSLLTALFAALIEKCSPSSSVFSVRCKLVIQLMTMLSRDMTPGSPITLRLDCSSPSAPKKKTTVKPYLHRPGWTETRFSDPWLDLSGQFIDGTVFSLRLSELTVVRLGQKGRKLKRKTKRKGVEACLMLEFPRKKYGALSLLKEELKGAIALPTGVMLKQIKASDQRLFLRVKVLSHSPLIKHSESIQGLYQLFTQLLLGAYQALNLSKALTAVKPSNERTATKAIKAQP